MGKRLIVAEKPSVGRDIAKVLGCRERIDGAIRGECDIVTWAVGHLVEQCYPEDMDDRYKEWKKEDLPIFPNPFQLTQSSGRVRSMIRYYSRSLDDNMHLYKYDDRLLKFYYMVHIKNQ